MLKITIHSILKDNSEMHCVDDYGFVIYEHRHISMKLAVWPNELLLAKPKCLRPKRMKWCKGTLPKGRTQWAIDLNVSADRRPKPLQPNHNLIHPKGHTLNDNMPWYKNILGQLSSSAVAKRTHASSKRYYQYCWYLLHEATPPMIWILILISGQKLQSPMD